jgi:hypothetical protein
MPNQFVTSLTALINAPPVLVAGVIALLGLLLWSAGVKVARAVSAALTGAVLTGVGWTLLPHIIGIGPELCGLIGLIVGVFIGAIGLRALQGGALAICLALAAGGGFYQWQIGHWAPAAHHAATAQHTQMPSSVSAALANATSLQAIRTQADNLAAQWQNIPGGLRQSMLVIGGGVAVLVLLLSWQVPRHTTWLVSAAVGAILLLLGGAALLELLAPRYGQMVPPPQMLAAIAAGATLVGMLVQRIFFWPGRREKVERAKDRSGETVPAV